MDFKAFSIWLKKFADLTEKAPSDSQWDLIVANLNRALKNEHRSKMLHIDIEDGPEFVAALREWQRAD